MKLIVLYALLSKLLLGTHLLNPLCFFFIIIHVKEEKPVQNISLTKKIFYGILIDKQVHFQSYPKS